MILEMGEDRRNLVEDRLNRWEGKEVPHQVDHLVGSHQEGLKPFV